jgi:hypothetical protein
VLQDDVPPARVHRLVESEEGREQTADLFHAAIASARTLRNMAESLDFISASNRVSFPSVIPGL